VRERECKREGIKHSDEYKKPHKLGGMPEETPTSHPDRVQRQTEQERLLMEKKEEEERIRGNEEEKRESR